MLIKDERGNELLEIIAVAEDTADAQYAPITHALLIVKIEQEFLMGWNHWRKNWEIFGGCREEGETLRECVLREAAEEIGLHNLECTYIGLMKFKMAPNYFSPDWREEYGALYGVTLPQEMLEVMEAHRSDKEEVENLASWMSLVEIVRWNFPGLETEEKVTAYRDTVVKNIRRGSAICALDGNVVVGILLFSKKYNMLCCMAVHPEYRRRGIATQMDIVVETFREEDEKGTAPRALYQSLGFEPGELCYFEDYYPQQMFVLKGSVKE